MAFAETVSDAEQIAAHLAQQRIGFNQAAVVALSLDAERWLVAAQLPWIPLRDIVVLEDALPQLYAKAVMMGDTWHELLNLEDDFFEQAAAPDFRRFYFHALVCEHALQGVLGSVRPKSVLQLPLHQTPFSIYHGHIREIASNGVFNAMLRSYCEQHRIPVIELDPPDIRRRMALQIQPCRRILSTLRRNVPGRRLFLVVAAQATCRTMRKFQQQPQAKNSLRLTENACCDVMIANWGYDMERNMRLNNVVTNPAFDDLRMVHLVHRKEMLEEPVAPNHLIAKTWYVGVSVAHYIDDFFLGVFVNRWLCFQRHRQALARTYGAWFADWRLDFQFLYMFFDVYEQIYRYRLSASSWLAKYRPAAFIVSDIDTTDFRSYLLAARKHGAITLSTNHGFYLYAPPRSNFLGDHCLVGGGALRNNLVRGGVSEEKVHVIGNASFGGLWPIAARLIEEQPTILIITAAPLDLWSYQYRHTEYVETLKDLCTMATENRTWQVVIKSHPVSDIYATYDDIVAQLQRPNLSHVATSWSRDQFGHAAVAVMFGISGSLLELQSYGTPIVFVDGFTQSYTHPDVQDCGEVVATSEKAAQAINQLLTDNSFRQEVVDRGYRFLKRYTDMPNNNIDRFAQVLKCTLGEEDPSHVPSTVAAQHSTPLPAGGQHRCHNILFVWQGLTNVGGVETFLLQALRRLPALGFQPYVLDLDSVPGPLEEQFAPFAPYVLRAPELLQPGATLWSTGLARQLQRLGIDLVVLNEWVYRRILEDLPPHLPVIAICHTDLNEPYFRNADLFATRLHSLVAVSKTIEQKLRNAVPFDRYHSVRMIRYGVENHVSENQQSIAAPPLRLIYLGRLVQKQKRIYDLIPFVKAINEFGVDYVFTIAGAGEAAADLESALADESASGRVRFVGPLSHDQAMIELGRQHLFLLFSEYEGLPLSLLEALVCGVVPVVTAIPSGISEILVDGSNARLFPVGQPEVAAAIVAELACDPAILRQLSVQALALGAQFNSEETFRHYAHLFTEATAPVDGKRLWGAHANSLRRKRMLASLYKSAPPFVVRAYRGLKTKLLSANRSLV